MRQALRWGMCGTAADVLAIIARLGGDCIVGHCIVKVPWQRMDSETDRPQWYQGKANDV